MCVCVVCDWEGELMNGRGAWCDDDDECGCGDGYVKNIYHM